MKMDESYRGEYERLYREHWWWRARETILVGVLRRLRPKPCSKILDVGCGNALSFPALADFGSVRGIEVDPKLLDDAGPFRAQISTDPLGSAAYDDPRWRFDVITALDVVEHIDDDRGAVARMAGMLERGGWMIITVPAFESLWDHHDEINLHCRRYTAEGLKRTLTGHGVEILELRYLFRSLFLPKLAIRLLNAGRTRKLAQHRVPGPLVNRALEHMCILEDRLLGRLPLPFGTSVLAVVRKPGVAG
jgi:2-polyprenyl-3-methyl-5-hydroxy-6-metoxy-1,4-benzoquinol methylase